MNEQGKRSKLKREIAELQRSHDEEEEFQMLAAGYSEDIATSRQEEPVADDKPKHADLDASCFLSKPKQGPSPAETSENKCAEKDNFFSVWKKAKRKSNWLDNK